jgi:hypothetical protein
MRIIYNDGSLAAGVSSPILTNCIVWGNSGGIFNSGGSANINFSIVQGGCPAGSVCSNVSNVDPLFVSGSNLHLQTGSPAINAGTNTGAPSTDIEGNFRALTLADPADMGAYEFPICTAPVITGVTNVNSSQATIHWSRVSTTTKYITRKYVAGTTDYVYGGYQKPITDTLKKILNMQPSTEYSVQVKSICFSGTDSSDWSAPVNFTTADICLPPTALNVTNIKSSKARLNWTPPAQLVSKFEIRTRASGSVLWDRRKKKADKNYMVLDSLSAGTMYEWQVRSLCADNDSSTWAIGTNFTTASSFARGATTTASDAKTQYSFKAQVMPNPNKGDFHN